MPRPEDLPRVFHPGLKLTDGTRFERFLGRDLYTESWQGIAVNSRRVVVRVILKAADAKKEVDLLKKVTGLNHPNLALPRKSLQDQERVFLLLEWVEGVSLQQRLAQLRQENHPGIPTAELVRYFGQVAQGLDFLHGRGAVHRDIQPENILVTKRTGQTRSDGRKAVQRNYNVLGQARLVGLGLFVNPETLASDQGAISWQYAAPEAFVGDCVPASDQYSLAACWIVLRLDHALFPQVDSPEQLRQAQTEETPSLEPLHASEQAVLRRALDNDPQARFASCSALVQALAQTKDTRAAIVPAKKKKKSPKKRGPSFSTREKLLALGQYWPRALAAVVLGLLVLWAGLAFNARENLDEEVATIVQAKDENRFEKALEKTENAGPVARLLSKNTRSEIRSRWLDEADKQLLNKEGWQKQGLASAQKTAGAILAKFPGDPQAESIQALAHHAEGILALVSHAQFAEAADLLQKVLEAKPELQALLETQLQGEWVRSAEEMLAKKDIAGARAAYEQMHGHFKGKNLNLVDALGKETLDALGKEVDSLLAQEKYGELKKLRELLQGDPEAQQKWLQEFHQHADTKLKTKLQDEKSLAQAVTFCQSFRDDLPARERSQLCTRSLKAVEEAVRKLPRVGKLFQDPQKAYEWLKSAQTLLAELPKLPANEAHALRLDLALASAFKAVPDPEASKLIEELLKSLTAHKEKLPLDDYYLLFAGKFSVPEIVKIIRDHNVDPLVFSRQLLQPVLKAWPAADNVGDDKTGAEFRRRLARFYGVQGRLVRDEVSLGELFANPVQEGLNDYTAAAQLDPGASEYQIGQAYFEGMKCVRDIDQDFINQCGTTLMQDQLFAGVGILSYFSILPGEAEAELAEKAHQAFDRAIELAESNKSRDWVVASTQAAVDFALQRGKLFARRRDPEKALQVFQRALPRDLKEMRPAHAPLLLRSVAYAVRVLTPKELEKLKLSPAGIRAQADRALELCRDDETRAQALCLAAESRTALARLDAAVKEDPKLQVQQRRAALGLFEQAIALDKEKNHLSDAWFYRAKYAEALFVLARENEKEAKAQLELGTKALGVVAMAIRQAPKKNARELKELEDEIVEFLKKRGRTSR